MVRLSLPLTLLLLLGHACAAPPPSPLTAELPPIPSSGASLSIVPGAPSVPAQEERHPVVWRPAAEERAVTERARAKGRPVVVRFWASWNMSDRELERALAAPAVAAELERYETIGVDATDDEDPAAEALKAKYRVVGLPTLIALDGNGNEAWRILQFENAEALVKKLALVHAR